MGQSHPGFGGGGGFSREETSMGGGYGIPMKASGSPEYGGSPGRFEERKGGDQYGEVDDFGR